MMGNGSSAVGRLPRRGLLAILLVAITAVVVVLAWGRGGTQQVAADTPHAGLDFSMEVVGVPGCTTKGGNTKCDLFAGNTFTVNFALNSTDIDYKAFQVRALYSGVTSKDNEDAHVWPDCVFEAIPSPRIPGEIFVGCIIGVGAPLSTHTGTIATVDFNCTEGQSTGNTITLQHGTPLRTLLTDADDNGHAEAAKDQADETLTINCNPVDINIDGDWGVTYVNAYADHASVCSVSYTQDKTDPKTEQAVTATGTCVLADGTEGGLSVSGTINRNTGEITASGTISTPLGDASIKTTAVVAKDGNTLSGTWVSNSSPDYGTFTAARVLESVETPVPAASGGTVETTDPDNPVQASLLIPPDSLAGDTTISVDVLLPGAEPPPEEFLPHVPDPSNAPEFVLIFDFGPPGTILDPPGQLTLTYDPSVITGDEEALGVLHFNQTTNQWEYLPVKNRDTVNNTLTVSVSSFSGYGIYDPAVADTDSDGCLDRAETGDVPSDGGQRNPLYYWDVFDTPNDANVRDRTIAISDVVRVIGRYGAEGDPAINPLTAPPPTGYHTALDRGALAGPNPWDREPADGNSAIGDIVAVLTQYGLDCRT